MKQKLVIKVSMNGQKSRCKAMKIAVGISGVESAALQGQDKNQIEVTGDGVDAVELTTSLRKSVGHAELVSVSPVVEKKEGEKKEVEKKESNKNETTVQQPPPLYWSPSWPAYHIYEYQISDYPNDNPSCLIM